MDPYDCLPLLLPNVAKELSQFFEVISAAVNREEAFVSCS